MTLREACLRWLASACCLTSATAAEPDCVPQTRLDVTTIDRRIVLVGEAHGTAEIPRFTAGLVCSLLRAGRSVIVGVEHSGEQQDALNRYLASSGGAPDRQDLLQGVNWKTYSDGRGSVAMFELVDEVRRLRRQGLRVGMLAIDRDENLDVPLEAAEQVHVAPADNALLNRMANQDMANKVLYAAILYPAYTIVVLSGYTHTSTVFNAANVALFGAYPPMGRIIAEARPVFTIGIETGGGERSATMGDGSKTYPLEAGPLYSDAVHVDAKVRFDRVTASPPARDAIR